MAAKISVLGHILSSFPYLRSAKERFPLSFVIYHLIEPSFGRVSHFEPSLNKFGQVQLVLAKFGLSFSILAMISNV